MKLQRNLDDWVDFRLREHTSPAGRLNVKRDDAKWGDAVVGLHDVQVLHARPHLISARAALLIPRHVFVRQQAAPLTPAEARVHHELEHGVQV